MEDNTKQPSTADASLYNGQPTYPGPSCPSARLTSCTPSISKNKGGVSVENVPYENKQWFVLRVSYGRVLKAKEFVEAKGLECYVPMRYKEVRKQGKKRIITDPLLPHFSLFMLHIAKSKHCVAIIMHQLVGHCLVSTTTILLTEKMLLTKIHLLLFLIQRWTIS